MAGVSEIVADLRDDLLFNVKRAVALFDTLTNDERADLYTEVALETLTRWCAKEPANDA